MQVRNRKRKQTKPQSPPPPSTKRSKITTSSEPYPDHASPSPEECRAVRDTLLGYHGFPKEFIKYRKQRKLQSNADKNGAFESSVNLDDDDDEGLKESVLDGLVSTILSQNTTDVNSRRAFANLKSVFLTWEDVLSAESKHIENAIRCGGLAPSKASCIKNMLNILSEKRGKLCLEYLRDLTVEEIKAELSQFKGIGPKTVACVLMFHLQQDDFPVDTHVYQIAKSIGWLPARADLKKAYIHLNSRIPDDLKFDLNCLLFTHGKVCRQCSMKGDQWPKKESCENPCPLITYGKNSII